MSPPLKPAKFLRMPKAFKISGPSRRSRRLKLFSLLTLWPILGLNLTDPVSAQARSAQRAFLTQNLAEEGVVETASGLQYKILVSGSGPRPHKADTVLIRYHGELHDGREFGRSEQAVFKISELVRGFAEGLMLMNKGSRFRLWVPSKLGYGGNPPGKIIPRHALLIFDVELRGFASPKELRAARKKLKKNSRK